MKTKNTIIELIPLFLTCLFAVIYIYLFDFLRYNIADTHNFVNAAKILFGNNDLIDSQSRITKPIILVIPGLLNYLFNVSIETIMLLQNIFLFIGTGYFFNLYLKNLNYSIFERTIAVYMLFTIQPIAVHSFELITDIAGLFFTVLILYLYTYSHYKYNSVKTLLLIVTISAGILSKESCGLAVIIIVADSIVNRNKKLIINNIITLGISGCIILLSQLYISSHFYTHTAIYNVIEEFKNNNGYYVNFQQILHSFDMYWALFIVSCIYMLYRLHTYKLYIASMLLTIPALFIWATVQDRTIAVAAPLFIVIFIEYIHNSTVSRFLKILILIFGFGNIVCSYLIYALAIAGILPIYYCLGFVAFGIYVYTEKIYVPIRNK